MRLGVLGGAFDPPHRGHLELARRAQAALGLDRVLLVPNAEPPWKPASPGRASAADRLALVRALVDDAAEACGSGAGVGFDCGLEACAIEVRRGGVSYTVDTLRELSAAHPGAEIVFILGADALVSLPRWKEPESLAALAVFAVHGRPGSTVAAPTGFRIVAVPGDEMTVASSVLRERLSTARPVRPDLTPRVAARIESDLLYLPVLPVPLAAHVEAVTAAGVALARRWALPETDVALACRYHDVFRGTPPSELLAMAEGAGVPMGEAEREFPLLLHGKLAARRLEATGPERPDAARIAVLDAVRYHTTGRGGMSPVEAVVLLADQVGKIWDSVTDVPMERGEALGLALRRKLAQAAKRGRSPHPDLVAAARDLGLAAPAGAAA